MDGKDENGRFVAGHSGWKGRPKRSQVDEIIQSLSNHFTPEKMIADLDEALRLAKSQNSARGIVNVWSFIADRTMGLPVKTIVHSQDGYDRLAALMKQVAAERAAEEAEEAEAVYVVEEGSSEDAAFKALIDSSHGEADGS